MSILIHKGIPNNANVSGKNSNDSVGLLLFPITVKSSMMGRLRKSLFYLLLRLPVFAAVKTATANVAPQESILTASTAGTAARAANNVLISKAP
jgi:hypothetical protein